MDAFTQKGRMNENVSNTEPHWINYVVFEQQQTKKKEQGTIINQFYSQKKKKIIK